MVMYEAAETDELLEPRQKPTNNRVSDMVLFLPATYEPSGPGSHEFPHQSRNRAGFQLQSLISIEVNFGDLRAISPARCPRLIWASRKLITFACESQKSASEANATTIVAVFFSIRVLHGFLKQIVQLRRQESSSACMPKERLRSEMFASHLMESTRSCAIFRLKSRRRAGWVSWE